ncbi:hypothetical protein N656DRAFT_783302 [Canariomyces notabilis]|uniref:Uncharacterized protein n=1 Tax=Canariomyces notabilis TaxID=2074819 RepID=A0AAN6QIF1_9PEZI|nr:hypothetical protein N656DRAFT_783302 [Canariomyces arenarius]
MLPASLRRLLVGLCFVTCVGADAGDDFSNNLFSDLAPYALQSVHCNLCGDMLTLSRAASSLLALFGERVTTQFMSQSMGWADNIVLAMAPLGVITAIVGAIRVGGPSWLKAIIGRARESRAVVEAELMSSTSNEVCELWNGQQIVRVMGEGPIREFIILMPKEGENGNQTRTAMTPEEMPIKKLNDAVLSKPGIATDPNSFDKWYYLTKYSEYPDLHLLPLSYFIARARNSRTHIRQLLPEKSRFFPN